MEQLFMMSAATVLSGIGYILISGRLAASRMFYRF